MNKLPRSRMRLKFKEMLPKEKGWFSAFSIKVLQNGDVFIEDNSIAWHFEGGQPWPEHNKHGDYLIEKLDDGAKLHIFSMNLFRPEDEDYNITESVTRITEIEIHDYELKSCRTCRGRGYLESEKL